MTIGAVQKSHRAAPIVGKEADAGQCRFCRARRHRNAAGGSVQRCIAPGQAVLIAGLLRHCGRQATVNPTDGSTVRHLVDVVGELACWAIGNSEFRQLAWLIRRTHDAGELSLSRQDSRGRSASCLTEPIRPGPGADGSVCRGARWASVAAFREFAGELGAFVVCVLSVIPAGLPTVRDQRPHKGHHHHSVESRVIGVFRQYSPMRHPIRSCRARAAVPSRMIIR